MPNLSAGERIFYNDSDTFVIISKTFNLGGTCDGDYIYIVMLLHEGSKDD